MLDIKRLILGTVQFGQDYVTKQVPPDEVYDILHYAYDNGITTLDTAYAYDNYTLLRSFMLDEDKHFSIISKVKNIGEFEETLIFLPGLDICLTHGFDEKLLNDMREINQADHIKLGMSIYKKNEIRKCSILQVPMIDEFIPLLDEHCHLRSIFGRGKKLKTKTVRECLKDAFDTKAGKIVVGVDSLAHLKEIVSELER